MLFEDGVFARALALGFAIAATFGPIGVLCLRRALSGGFVVGFVSGLGAATADAAYASLAAFGLTVVTSMLVDAAVWLGVLGGVFLVYLGLRTLAAAPSTASRSEQRLGVVRAYVSTLLLTLSNPMTIISFVAIFAGLGLADAAGGATLVVGVFVGSAAWWLVLAGVASRLRGRLTPHVLRLVNIGSGLLIAGFGVAALGVRP